MISKEIAKESIKKCVFELGRSIDALEEYREHASTKRQLDVINSDIKILKNLYGALVLQLAEYS